MDSKSYKRSFVSRSKYQKVVEENKRLLKDLRAICTGITLEGVWTYEGIKARRYWREYFEKLDKEKAEIREILSIGKELLKEGKI